MRNSAHKRIADVGSEYEKIAPAEGASRDRRAFSGIAPGLYAEGYTWRFTTSLRANDLNLALVRVGGFFADIRDPVW
jgi:hypothetical protein